MYSRTTAVRATHLRGSTVLTAFSSRVFPGVLLGRAASKGKAALIDVHSENVGGAESRVPSTFDS